MRCVLIVSIINVLVTITVQQHGRQIDNCIWEYDDGKRVDLNGIGNVDGTARWNNESTLAADQDPNLYTINPCHGVTLGTECTDVTVCRISNLGIPLNIADASSGRMYYNLDEENVVLEYNHTSTEDPNLTYISRLVVTCAGDVDQIVVQGVESPTSSSVTHRFILLAACVATIAPPITTHTPMSAHPIVTGNTPPASMSPHPIVTGNTPPASMSIHPIRTVTPHVTGLTIKPGSSTSSLTAGGVICIIFVCGVCGYFLIGAVYMFCYSGARGVEIIPNVHFWLDLPNLILDGFSFLFSCCGKTTIVSSPGLDYDKI